MDDTKDANEDALMQHIAEGDQPSYRQVMNAQLPSINRFALRLTGNRSDADDITQEVFIRLWSHAHTWRPGQARISTWLHRIANNLCVDLFRKNRRLQPLEDPEAEPGGSEPDYEHAGTVATRRIDLALASLPERQRTAIIMCHYQGLSNREAANILDVSVDALESLLSRGRRTLRQKLMGGRQ